VTSEEIDALTLADVKRITERATEAIAKFAEARALLGIQFGPPSDMVPVAFSAPVGYPAPANRRPPTTKGIELTPDELAQREALMLAARGLTPEEEEALVNGR
jgi:hypothetical protein